MDEELVLGPRRRLPRRAVQVVCASVGGVAVFVAAAVVALAPPALTGHGSEHVAPRPEIVQPLKGAFLT